MPPEQNERARALGQDVASKLARRDWVQGSIIPELNARDRKSEASLLALHYASTWGVKNREPLSPFDRCWQAADRLGITQGMTPKESRRTATQLSRGEHPTLRIALPNSKERGRYRLLATVTDRRRTPVKVVQVWRERDIQVFTPEGECYYSAPQNDVGSLMFQLCRVNDRMRELGNDPAQVALRAAFFYSVGNKCIHPFVDANHRAFDRFLEAEFARAGIELNLPQDSSGNIPPDSRIKVLASNVVTNLLRLSGLPLFRYRQTRQQEMLYQNILSVRLQELISKNTQLPIFLYLWSLMAAELLKHTPTSGWESTINGYFRQAEGAGVIVQHRR